MFSRPKGRNRYLVVFLTISPLGVPSCGWHSDSARRPRGVCLSGLDVKIFLSTAILPEVATNVPDRRSRNVMEIVDVLTHHYVNHCHVRDPGTAVLTLLTLQRHQLQCTMLVSDNVQLLQQDSNMFQICFNLEVYRIPSAKQWPR